LPRGWLTREARQNCIREKAASCQAVVCQVEQGIFREDG
jgi:hypothetical protein